MKNFIKITIFIFLCCYGAILWAGPGYCSKCSCNRADKDPIASDGRYSTGNKWICYCKHTWGEHYNGDRPSVSFSGNHQNILSKKDFFDDPINIILLIAAIIGVIVSISTKYKGGGLLACILFILKVLASC